jgi:Ca2+-dependent lipid-binding protein
MLPFKLGDRDAGTLYIMYAMLKEPSKQEELSWKENGIERDAKTAKGIGCLHVGLYSARDLVACDVNGYSDPFIQIAVGGAMMKSKVIKKSTNPTFNEAIIVDVQPGASVVEIQVYDHDIVGNNEFMGQVLFSVSQLVAGEEKRSKFTLCPPAPPATM